MKNSYELLNYNNKLCILVLLYNETIHKFEEKCLINIFNKFGEKYDIYGISINDIDITYYKKFNFKDFKVLKDITNYNFILTKELFVSFNSYEFCLVCNTFTWIFSNNIEKWLEKNYDIIGTPIYDFNVYDDQNNIIEKNIPYMLYKYYKQKGHNMCFIDFCLIKTNWIIENFNKHNINKTKYVNGINVNEYEFLFIYYNFKFNNHPTVEECITFCINTFDFVYCSSILNYNLPLAITPLNLITVELLDYLKNEFNQMNELSLDDFIEEEQIKNDNNN